MHLLELVAIQCLLLAATVSGCKWMDDIQEQVVDYKVSFKFIE